MSKRITLAASLLLPAALLWSTGCKSNSSTPEQASQPPTQAAPAPSSATPPSGSAAPSAAPASTAQPAPAASSAGAQPAAPATVATNAPAPVATAPPPPPPPPPPIVVPAGTVLHVRLVQAVGSKISQEGSRFDATLSSSVVVRGQRVIPSGTRAVGTVTEAHPSGRFKGGATLGVELNSLHINGQIYPIRTSQVTDASKGKGKRTAGFIGGGGAGGALIGGLAGGGKGALIGGLIGAGAGTAGAATGNRDITLQSEAPLSFTLASSLTLPPGSAKSKTASDTRQELTPTAPQP